MNTSRRREAKSLVDVVRVGLMKAPSVALRLNGQFEIESPFAIDATSGCIAVSASSMKAGDVVRFVPMAGTEQVSSVEIDGVEIGVDFHWSELKTFSYRGSIELRRLVGDELIQVVNVLPIEMYIRSVIGSEMAPTCNVELLKAHAIISRTWLVRQIRNKVSHNPVYRRPQVSMLDGEMMQIWDAEGHTDFDVCADDHCQRYQGINDGEEGNVAKAIAETDHMILKDNGAVCDARFSKCCGGVSEVFSTCWTDEDYDYLKPVRCSYESRTSFPNLRVEAERIKWIQNPPTDVYCSSTDASVLSRVLKSYDQRTTDEMYRWKVEYRSAELAAIIKEKAGIDVGSLIDLLPVEVGPSGRIKKLMIIGTKGSQTIGKELMIRRTLSRTHLLSSAFYVEKSDATDGKVFTLYGAGWGHGVGMCQVGAAVMAEQGHSCEQILELYYPGSQLVKM